MAAEGFPRGNGRWPSRERVVFADPGGVASSPAESLVKQGVPRSLMGLAYRACDELIFIELPFHGPVIWFGVSGYSERICVDPQGRVIGLVGSEGDYQVNLVNSSLGQFVQSVDLLVERFPFYGIDDSEDRQVEVAEDVVENLRRIDANAIGDADGYWATFVDELAMGDYATELIISQNSQ